MHDTTLSLPELKIEQQKLKAGDKPFSLLLMDVDLKTVNQIQGHDVGDQVLKSAISSIRGNLEPEDKVYRYEGAEFVISLHGKSFPLKSGRYSYVTNSY